MQTNTIPDIVRGEARSLRITFASAATAPQLAADYRLGLSANRSGPDLVTIDFGPGHVRDGGWDVTLTPAQTLALPAGTVYADVWEAGAPSPVAVAALSVGNVAGRPG
jgi:hypothetical protein